METQARKSGWGDFFLRCLLASFGLCVCGFAVYLQVVADVGMSPWNQLSDGLSRVLGMPFGRAHVLTSVLVIVIDLLLREHIGVGTILDAVLVGVSADAFAALGLVHKSDSLLVNLLMLVAGIAIMCVGQVFYMRAALCCGPRDALMVALGKKFRRFSIGTVTAALFIVVLIAAWAMGSHIGVGTLIAVVGTGPVMDFIFHLFRFEPRDVQHEGFAETLRRFTRGN